MKPHAMVFIYKNICKHIKINISKQYHICITNKTKADDYYNNLLFTDNIILYD